MLTAKRRYQFLYFAYFVAGTGIIAFRNAYFEEIGLSGAQMGLLGAILVVGGMIAQPAWGALADVFGRSKHILAISAVVSAGAALLFPLAPTVAAPFLLLVVASATFSVFRAPALPLINAMTLSSGVTFGHVRAFGSIAFGISILALGGVLALFQTAVIFPIYAAGMAVFVVGLWGLTDPPSADIAPDLRRDAVALLTNRRFLLLLVVSAVIGGVTASGDAFFAVYMRAIEAGDDMTGVAWALKTVVEAAVFLVIPNTDLDYRRQLLLGAVSFVAYGVLAITTSTLVVIGAHVFLGAGIGFFFLSSVNLAHRFAPAGLASTAQAVLTGLGLGAGRAAGQVVAGRLFDLVGVQDLYLYLAAGAAVATVATLGFWLLPARPDGDSPGGQYSSHD